MLINFVGATNDANHYTKPPHVLRPQTCAEQAYQLECKHTG